MKYLLLAIFVLSTTAISAEKKTVAQVTKKSAIVEPDSKTLDVVPTDKNKEIAEETALYTDPPAIKEKVSCKTKDGHEIKAGEKGYEACIKKFKASKHNPKAEVKVEFEKQ